MLAGNVCGLVAARPGGTSRRGTVALPRIVDVLLLPSVSEPFLAWTISGEVEFQEREDKGPWITQRLTKGSFFLTSGGALVVKLAMTPRLEIFL
jgi:hypothetical protein